MIEDYFGLCGDNFDSLVKDCLELGRIALLLMLFISSTPLYFNVSEVTNSNSFLHWPVHPIIKKLLLNTFALPIIHFPPRILLKHFFQLPLDQT